MWGDEWGGGGGSIGITKIKGGRGQFKENLPKQGPQGPQKLSSLKSLNILNPPPIPGIFTPGTIMEIASFQILGCKTVKIVQQDPQTMEIWSKKLNVT